MSAQGEEAGKTQELELSDGSKLEVGEMTAADREQVLAFAAELPTHDLLFLRRDITRPEVVDKWLHDIDEGRIKTLLARRDGKIVGYATIDRRDLEWSRHVAELRIAVGAAMRGLGLGRRLTELAFRTALEDGVEKMVARMTLDQDGAIAMFKNLGFQPEAVLRDHVKDREGVTHDLLMLSHRVAAFECTRAGYGVIAALGG